MQYKVFYEQASYMFEAIENLEKEVKMLIADGWKPLCGISISSDASAYACQTMVK